MLSSAMASRANSRSRLPALKHGPGAESSPSDLRICDTGQLAVATWQVPSTCRHIYTYGDIRTPTSVCIRTEVCIHLEKDSTHTLKRICSEENYCVSRYTVPRFKIIHEKAWFAHLFLSFTGSVLGEAYIFGKY